MASNTAGTLARWATAAFCTALSGVVQAAQWNLQEPATAMAAEIHGLHVYVMILVIVIFVGVFGAMFYSIYAHRKSNGHKASQFHENTTVEVIWTVVPLLILIVIAWPVTKTVIAQKDTYIEGKGIRFFSTLATPRDQIEGRAPKGEHYLREVDNEIVVPIGKKVRVLTTAADVVHSWWIPAFGAKQDAMPGFIRNVWFRADTSGPADVTAQRN